MIHATERSLHPVGAAVEAASQRGSESLLLAVGVGTLTAGVIYVRYHRREQSHSSSEKAEDATVLARASTEPNRAGASLSSIAPVCAAALTTPEAGSP